MQTNAKQADTTFEGNLHGGTQTLGHLHKRFCHNASMFAILEASALSTYSSLQYCRAHQFSPLGATAADRDLA